MGRQDYETETLIPVGGSFDVAPILEAGKRTGKSTTDPRAGHGIGSPGDPMFTLQSGAQHAIAFNARQDPDAWDERSGPLDTDGTTQAVAFAQNQCGEVRTGDIANTLNTNTNASGRNTPMAHGSMGVRRLTPRECERLQGFPDEWTLVPYSGKPASDRPRYQALGNSMAVPVVRWIGERINLVEEVGT